MVYPVCAHEYREISERCRTTSLEEWHTLCSHTLPKLDLKNIVNRHKVFRTDLFFNIGVKLPAGSVGGCGKSDICKKLLL